MRTRALAAGLLVAALWLSGTAAAEAPAWPDTFVARLEALALLQSLNADLLSHDSATDTLRRWCTDHQLAAASKIVALRDRSEDKAPDAEVMAALRAGPGETVRYRRVRLACGDRVLSQADNWYLPGRLTPEMNRLLDQTDTPFGVAVKDLKFQRRTLSARLLYQPLPEGWDLGARPGDAAGPLAFPHQLIQHRAVLATPGGAPFSVVVETYTDQVLPDRAP